MLARNTDAGKKTESTYEKLKTFFFIEKQINSENITLTYENTF